MATWQVQEAKARFSELMRGADEAGPQTITVRGRRAAVLLSANDYDRLRSRKPSLTALMRASPLAGIELTVDRDQTPPARCRSVSFLVRHLRSSPNWSSRNRRVTSATWFDAAPPEVLFVSVLTLGEIRKGVEKLDRRSSDAHRSPRGSRTTLPAWFEDRVLPVDAGVADEWGSSGGPPAQADSRHRQPHPLRPLSGTASRS